MHLSFAHLVDYATEDRRRKLVLGGIFEFVMVGPERPITLPHFFLVARFNAHVTEGREHRLRVKFSDADGGDLLPAIESPLTFVPEGPRRQTRAQLIAEMNGLRLPDVGDYVFSFFVDDHRIGEVPLAVVAIQSPAAP